MTSILHKAVPAKTAAAIAGTALGLTALSAVVLPGGIASADPSVKITPGVQIAVPDRVNPDIGKSCTLAYLLTDSQHDIKALTAGHCGTVGQDVYATDPPAQIGTISAEHAPQVNASGNVIGDITTPDWAVININNDVSVDANTDKIIPRIVGIAAVGDKVCSQGNTSGWACGTVTAVLGDWITTTIKRAPGDSGGPLYRPADHAAIGLLSNTEKPLLGPGPESSRYYAVAAVLRTTGLKLGVDRAQLINNTAYQPQG